MDNPSANHLSSRGPVPERVISLVSLLATSLVVGGLVCAAWRGAIGIYWFRQWWHWRAADPSAAELYQLNWWFETIPTIIGLALASAGIVLLRRQR